jgi:phosphoenolpyruvate carboxykinase (GTP)
VNWFRKGADGKFLWPGFGENIRVLQWIIDRCNGRADATKTPLGWAPDCDDLDLSGLPAAGSAFAELQAVDRQAWLDELQAHTELLNCLGPGVPDEILRERDALAARLAAL